MKSLYSAILSIALVILATTKVGAQDIDSFSNAATDQSQNLTIEVSMKKYAWGSTLSRDEVLSAVATAIESARGQIRLGQTSKQLLERIAYKKRFSGSEWINQSSRVLRKGVLEVPTFVLELEATKESDSKRTQVKLARDKIRLESGWSKATITGTLFDCETGLPIKTFVGVGRRDSINTDGIDAVVGKLSKLGGFQRIGYSSSSKKSPVARRDYLAAQLSLEDLLSQVVDFVRTNRISNED